MRSRAVNERGAGTGLVAVICLGMAAVLAAGVIALGWFESHARATRAADLAAVAGAKQYATDGEACATAKGVAQRNHTRQTGCTVKGDRTSFVVTIEIEADLWPKIDLPGAPRKVRVTAIAGSANAAP